jgi:hypothetical protein
MERHEVPSRTRHTVLRKAGTGKQAVRGLKAFHVQSNKISRRHLPRPIFET